MSGLEFTLGRTLSILAVIPPQCGDLNLWAQAADRLVEAGQERIAELQEATREYSNPGFLKS